jgi:hypothetical protein
VGPLLIVRPKRKKNGSQDLKEKRNSPSRRSLQGTLQQGAGSSGALRCDPVATSGPAVEIPAKGRDKPTVRHLSKVKQKNPYLGSQLY